LKLITSVDSEDDLNIFDEEMSDKMSFNTFSALEFLLDSSQTFSNRRMIN